MGEITRAVYADFECEPVEFHGEHNHAHPPVKPPSKMAIPQPVNSLKGLSFHRTRQESPDLVHHQTNHLRSGPYLAGSLGGAPLAVSPQYTERQNRPGQGTLRPDGPPTRSFTTGLKPGALTRTPVALFPPGQRYSRISI